MSSTVMHKTASSLAIPQTQNTAPVLEFNCLYTHDLRRKQKRWQDGFLRYHTFNKRIMVYDVPRNYIGDAHWSNDEQLQDGDELTLDKGSALVQVLDGIGQTETDLTELRRSVRKPPSMAPAAKENGPPLICALYQMGTTKGKVQPKHRPLTSLLSGRNTHASQSPFEQRKAEVAYQTRRDENVYKRRKLEPTKILLPLQSKTPPTKRNQVSEQQSTSPIRRKGQCDGADVDFALLSPASVLRSSPLQRSSKKPALLQRGGSYHDPVLIIEETSHHFQPEQTREIDQGSVLRTSNIGPKKKLLLCQTSGIVLLPNGAADVEQPPSHARSNTRAKFYEMQRRDAQRQLDRVKNGCDVADQQTSVELCKRPTVPDMQPIAKSGFETTHPHSKVKTRQPSEDDASTAQAVSIPGPANTPILQDDPSKEPEGDHAQEDSAKEAEQQNAIPEMRGADATTDNKESKGSKMRIASKFQRTGDKRKTVTSLDVSATGAATVLLHKPFKAQKPGCTSAMPPPSGVMPSEPDPWSREAFDLFAWRPPGWNEEKWCMTGDDNAT